MIPAGYFIDERGLMRKIPKPNNTGLYGAIEDISVVGKPLSKAADEIMDMPVVGSPATKVAKVFGYDDDPGYGRHYDRISSDDEDFQEDAAENAAQGHPIQRAKLNVYDRWGKGNEGEGILGRMQYRNQDRLEDIFERLYNRQTRKEGVADDMGLDRISDMYDRLAKRNAERGMKWSKKQ